MWRIALLGRPQQEGLRGGTIAGEGIYLESKGSKFNKTITKLEKLRNAQIFNALDSFGAIGTAALQSATPVQTGITAMSWTHEIRHEGGVHSIVWKNTHIVDGVNIAVIIQYGHGTGTGGYVVGQDYINPVILPLFEKIKAEIRKAVSSA